MAPITAPLKKAPSYDDGGTVTSIDELILPRREEEECPPSFDSESSYKREKDGGPPPIYLPLSPELDFEERKRLGESQVPPEKIRDKGSLNGCPTSFFESSSYKREKYGTPESPPPPELDFEDDYGGKVTPIESTESGIKTDLLPVALPAMRPEKLIWVSLPDGSLIPF